MSRLSRTIISSLLSLTLVYGNALAQTAGSLSIEEIVVTAQKREESVQNVPIAINVLAGDQLSRLNVVDSNDLTRLFPNFSLKQAHQVNTGFTIRGVGTDNYHPIAQPSVGTYIDEVSLVSPYASSFQLFDMDRVEVLRGPQNSLFGRNTTGGAINFISRKPEVGAGTNGYLRAKAGNAGRIDFEGALGAPLGDNAALRIAAQSLNRDGVFRNLVNGEKRGDVARYAARAQLAWQPSDETDVLFSIRTGYNRSDVMPWRAIGVFDANGVDRCPLLDDGISQWQGPSQCVALNPATGELVNVSTDNWHDVYDVTAKIADADIEALSLRVDHDYDNFTLTSLTSYDLVSVLLAYNNGAAAPFMNFWAGQQGDWEVFTQEIRLTSIGDGPMRWIAGGFYSTETDDIAVLVRNGAIGTPPFTVLPSVDLDQDVDILSAYGQIEYDASDQMTLTVGLRFTDDNKAAASTVRVAAGTDTGDPTGTRLPDDAIIPIEQRRLLSAGGAACPPPPLPCQNTIPVAQNLSEWGGKIGVDYRFRDDVMGYASYSRGFKSGAFDTRALAAFVGTADQPTGPEFLDAFEAGVKSTLADGTLELNAALFFYLWDDLQVFDSDPVTGAPAFINVPETEILGAEAELRWAPGDGWYVQGGLGLLDSEIIEAPGFVTVTEGAAVNLSPEVSLNGLIIRDIELANSTLSLQTDFRYISEMNSLLTGVQEGIIDAAFFINARAAWVFGADGQYTLSAWGDNLTGVETCYDTENIGALTFTHICQPNEGMAFYGIEFQIDF